VSSRLSKRERRFPVTPFEGVGSSFYFYKSYGLRGWGKEKKRVVREKKGKPF